MMMMVMMIGDVDDDDVDDGDVDDDDDATEVRLPSQPRSRDRANSAGCRNMAGTAVVVVEATFT